MLVSEPAGMESAKKGQVYCKEAITYEGFWCYIEF